MTARTYPVLRGFYATMSPRTALQTGPYTVEPVRVLIVEDHQLLSEALARSLEDEDDISVVGLARTVAEAMQRFRMGPIDVVLLDYNLPDGDGLVVVRRIIKEYPGTHVIMVTAREDRDMVRAALAAGCAGFIGKSESFVHLPNAIRSAAQGTTAISPAITALLIRDADPPAEGAASLTERERTMLQLLAKGFSKPDIAEQMYVSEHTLRNYLNHINAKLDTHSQIEALSKALRLGIIRIEEERGGGDKPPSRRRRKV